MSNKKIKEVVVEVVKTKEELMAEALKSLSPEQIAILFPPKQMKNFVVRKSWYGRNQVITFTNNKNQVMTYNHDEVLDVMLPKLNLMPCWLKRGYWSQSTNMPMNVRHLATVVEPEVVEAE